MRGTVSISLAASRNFALENNKTKQKSTIKLNNGDVLYMERLTHQQYRHILEHPCDSNQAMKFTLPSTAPEHTSQEGASSSTKQVAEQSVDTQKSNGVS